MNLPYCHFSIIEENDCLISCRVKLETKVQFNSIPLSSFRACYLPFGNSVGLSRRPRDVTSIPLNILPLKMHKETEREVKMEGE
jgi:hypothetical protein